MTIKFYDRDHRAFFEQHNTGDVYQRAFFYTIGLCPATRSHAAELYDTGKRQILPEAMSAEWQTGTSAKVTRLAFNLFTDGTPTAYRFDENNRDLPVNDDDRREAALFSVSDIFCCEYAAYFFEAIKLRYPEYFHNP